MPVWLITVLGIFAGLASLAAIVNLFDRFFGSRRQINTTNAIADCIEDIEKLEKKTEKELRELSEQIKAATWSITERIDLERRLTKNETSIKAINEIHDNLTRHMARILRDEVSSNEK